MHSVLNQSYENLEVILINDASTDNSAEVCNHLAQLDSRIVVKNNTFNQGQATSRNYGIEVANGDYVLFLDSDDWWKDKNMLSEINQTILESHSHLILFGRIKYDTQSKRYYDRLIPDKIEANEDLVNEYNELLRKDIFLASACDKVLSMTLIDKLGLRFVEGQYSEDIEWTIKLLTETPKFTIISKDWYVYRQSPTSLSHNIQKKHVTDIISVLRCYSEKYKDNNIIQCYLGMQYIYLLITSSRLNSVDFRYCLPELKSLRYLLKKANSNKTRNIARIIQYIGITIFTRLLRILN